MLRYVSDCLSGIGNLRPLSDRNLFWFRPETLLFYRVGTGRASISFVSPTFSGAPLSWNPKADSNTDCEINQMLAS